MFAVDVDEPIAGGTLTLNGRSARLKKNMDGRYWAKWNGSDADGKIDILYPDGGKASCRIGYVTHGMSIQNFSVSKRICRWTLTTDD
jgi:hypothetical protein